MTGDSDLAAVGGLASFYDGDNIDGWAKSFFGATWVAGIKPMKGTVYFYLYDTDIDEQSLDYFIRNHIYDGKLISNDGTGIFLWEVE